MGIGWIFRLSRNGAAQNRRSMGAWSRRHCILFSFGVAAALVPRIVEGRSPLFLGVTTSTENSGLLAALTEAFEAEHGIEVRAVTAGSGAVLNLAARGDVDVVLVHSPDDEAAFIEAGFGIDRREVMSNRFVIVGPKGDPAGIRKAESAADAFAAMAALGAGDSEDAPEGQPLLFLSRGDDSGTHKAELRIWQAAGIDRESVFEGQVSWYRESGSGQGATLNIAANMGAYTLTDEATFATFGNPGDLDMLFATDEPLLANVYSIIRVHPERHSDVNAGAALTFADWLTSRSGQAVIASFKADGRQLFRSADRLSG